MNDLNIKEIREKLGVSQETLAEMVGVHPRTIQNWESGTKIPKSKHAILRDLVLKPQNYAGGEQQNVNGDNINGNNVTVHKTDTDKLLEILASKEQSLAKAQESRSITITATRLIIRSCRKKSLMHLNWQACKVKNIRP